MRHFYHIIPAILTWILLALTLIAGLARFVPPSLWAFPQVVCLALPALAVLCVCAGVTWAATRHIILPVATGITLLLILSLWSLSLDPTHQLLEPGLPFHSLPAPPCTSHNPVHAPEISAHIFY